MHYAYRFRLKPTAEQRETLDYHRDTCRQLYNYALKEFNKIPDSAGTLNQRVRQVRDQLTDLKDWWDELNDLYSTVAQAAVMQIEDSIKALSELKKGVQRRESQLEGTERVPQFHIRPVWLRVRQEERSDCPLVVETRGYSN